MAKEAVKEMFYDIYARAGKSERWRKVGGMTRAGKAQQGKKFNIFLDQIPLRFNRIDMKGDAIRGPYHFECRPRSRR